VELISAALWTENDARLIGITFGAEGYEFNYANG
jgi:hypothetical protein